MNVSAPFIKRPIGTSLLAFGLFLFGMTAYFFLPIAPLPKVDFPTISVNASVPGIDPATAASALAGPLERRIGQIAGVTEMTSSSGIGSASINVQFDFSRDVDDAARDVQAAINAAAHDLPVMPNPPTYRKYNPADSPIIVLAMTSKTMPLSEIYNLADLILLQRLSQLPGVSQVGVYGGAKSAVRIQVNPSALAAMGLSIEDIRTFLQGANELTPKGSIDGDDRTMMITVNDQIFGADHYRSLVVAERNGSPVRLGDVANVFDGTENTRQAGWFDTERSVLLLVMKDPNANVIQVADEVRATVPLLRAWLPPGVKLDVLSDRTGTIRASVYEVQFTLVLTVALVITVMAIFLRHFWSTMIAGITVPLSLAGTFAVMWIWDFSLDNLSLMALTVAVGFLVDDAIVVIENNVRLLDEGASPMEAALLGTKQIGFTIISISLSLIVVFVPILLMGGIVGRLFHEFAITLCSAIVISAIVSLTLTPSLCARFLRRHEKPKPSKFSSFFQDIYAEGLRWVLRHRGFTQCLTLATIIGTIWLYTIIPKGYFPEEDTGLLIGITESGQDISFSAMSEKQQNLVKVLLKDPAIAHVGSFLGSGSSGSENSGKMYISLVPPNERPPMDAVIDRLRAETANIPGISLYLVPVQDLKSGAHSTKSIYQYSLRDSDLDELNAWVPKLVEELKKSPRLVDVNSDQQFGGLQTTVTIDRNAAGRLGISPTVVDSTLNSAFGQRMVSIERTLLNQYRVVLEATPEYQTDPSALDKIFIRAGDGSMVPLSSIAHYEEDNTPLSVSHQGQLASITISFDVAPGVTLDEATRIVDHAALMLGMPESISRDFAGNAKAFRDSANAQPLVYLSALIAVYIVLGMLYESLVHPLTIISTLPSAGVGALLALQITGMELSIVAMIGIILLIGIVKKNAILMVDFAIAAQREGLTPEEAIYQACLVRFRPIFMTTLAALFGSLPLAIGIGVGSELRRPLGVAIVGGLMVSQVLTLFTTPVIYLGLEKIRLRFAERRRLRHEARRARRRIIPAT